MVNAFGAFGKLLLPYSPIPSTKSGQHHLKSTNMLVRLNEEIKRRTQVVRIFPNTQSCLRLIRALAVETHENWLKQHRYLNMEELREHQKTNHAASCLIPLRALR
jgi:putative transposase